MSIIDAINKTQEDIIKLEEQVNFLNRVSNGDEEIRTIEEWQKLCDTPMRHEKCMVDIARKIFPMATNFKYGCNEITFTINGIKLILPTTRSKHITLNTNLFRLRYIQQESPKLKNQFPCMRKYFKLLDSGEYTWERLAGCRCTYTNYDPVTNTIQYTNYTKFKLALWWFTKGKWRKVDRKPWEERFDAEDRQNEKAIKDWEDYNNTIGDKIAELKEVVNIVSKFADVRCNAYKDSIYQQVNLKDYIEERYII